MSIDNKFRDFDCENKTIRYFDLDGYDRNEHDCYGNITKFAGKKDFLKKDIYVGDILSEKWKVEIYQNDEGTFMVRFHTNPQINKPMSLKKYLQKRKIAGCEETDNVIIGNIYENPELLSV